MQNCALARESVTSVSAVGDDDMQNRIQEAAAILDELCDVIDVHVRQVRHL